MVSHDTFRPVRSAFVLKVLIALSEGHNSHNEHDDRHFEDYTYPESAYIEKAYLDQHFAGDRGKNHESRLMNEHVEDSDNPRPLPPPTKDSMGQFETPSTLTQPQEESMALHVTSRVGLLELTKRFWTTLFIALGLFEQPLMPDLVRVRWLCVCSQMLGHLRRHRLY